MSRLFPCALRDERIREYLPIARIMSADGVDNPGCLLGSVQLQPAGGGRLSGSVIAPGGMLLLDYAVELQGGIRIVNDSDWGGVVRIRFGESVSEAMRSPNQDHAIHDSVQMLPMLGVLEYGNTAFRFVSVENKGDKPLRIINIIAVALSLDLEYLGSFESSDERLNKIWQVGARTVHLNMQDYIYDGVKRDRLVWMGDFNPEMRTILAAFGNHKLLRKTLDFSRDTTPLPQSMNSITTYSFWYVICLAEYYWWAGDRAYLEQQKEYVMGQLTLFNNYIQHDNGSECVPEFRFLDWPSHGNEEVLHAGIQGLLLWTMRSGLMLCQQFGWNTDLCCHAVDLLQKHIPDCKHSKEAAAMQTLGGLADRSELLQYNPLQGLSTFFGFYILCAQPTTPALNVIRRYWGAMLDRGATSFWEDFDMDWLKGSGRIDEIPVPGEKDLHKDFGCFCYQGLRHSLCHGWAGGPTAFLSERILGIHFLTPGGEQIAIKPDIGDLEYVKGSLPTPHGVISLEITPQGIKTLELPQGITWRKKDEI